MDNVCTSCHAWIFARRALISICERGKLLDVSDVSGIMTDRSTPVGGNAVESHLLGNAEVILLGSNGSRESSGHVL